MSADGAVSEQSLKEFESLAPPRPRGDQELLHHLWLQNSYARYLCFVVKDYSASQAYTERIMTEVTGLFSASFERFDAEAKCFPVFLLLNVARLSARNNQKALSKIQFEQLRSFIAKPRAGVLAAFPKVMSHLLEGNTETLSSFLKPDSQSYFDAKIQKGLTGLGG